jgi:hypothetical protein
MSGFWTEFRFGLRSLARSPVFTITALLLLGTGIGANTLIFSVVDTLLLRPLPVKNPEQLVRLVEVHPTNFVTWDLPHVMCEPLAHAYLRRGFGRCFMALLPMIRRRLDSLCCS